MPGGKVRRALILGSAHRSELASDKKDQAPIRQSHSRDQTRKPPGLSIQTRIAFALLGFGLL